MTHEASSSSISRSVRPNSVFLAALNSETETLTGVVEQILASDHERKHSKLMVRGGDHNLIVRGDQKSVNLQFNTVGRRDDNMIVPPSDGPMFILINWE